MFFLKHGVDVGHTAKEHFSHVISQAINQYRNRKYLHRDVASTVQIITVYKMHNSKQYHVKITGVFIVKCQKRL